jgi:sulfate/thiosulfate transport system ATP-binding protein
MSVSVTIEHIEKAFNGHQALKDANLDIGAGELVALLGPSGSGKTSLLRIIAGLDFPNSGRVLFDETDTCSLSIKDRNIGFVFQHYALFRHMTVFENIAFGLRARPRSTRPSDADIKSKVMTLLDLVQLPGLAARFPAHLSGGQRQRVALARALAIEPRVLLLDEPFGALDAKVRKELRRWLRELHDRTGHTTLFVTHDQEEALELADRVAILNEGHIEQVGSGDDLYERPATAFVHRFVGDSIELPISVFEGEAWFEGKSIYALPSRNYDEHTSLFLHPHDLRLTEDGRRSLPAKVLTTRRTANGRRAEVRIGSTSLQAEVELPAGRHIAPGEIVHLHLNHAIVFADNVVALNRNKAVGEVSRRAKLRAAAQ